MPTDYPSQPPTANFRTAIFHPNVHPETGGVCVETLKRDWDSSLTLRDVLITISCLLIQPNPDSALNAEAGSLIQEDFELFARRAQLMTSIHAMVPSALAEAVQEARSRGQVQESHEDVFSDEDQLVILENPVHQRRQTTRARQRYQSRRFDGSPSETVGDRHQRIQSRRERQESHESFQTPQGQDKLISDDIVDADQENWRAQQCTTPFIESSASTPRRPPGPPIPLGELTLDADEMEAEYPPSPRKSPVKRQLFFNGSPTASNHNLMQLHQGTPQDLSDTSIHILSPSQTPIFSQQPTSQPNAVEQSTSESKEEMDIEISNEQLWKLCGQDVQRWNRCDFDGQPYRMLAKRW